MKMLLRVSHKSHKHDRWRELGEVLWNDFGPVPLKGRVLARLATNHCGYPAYRISPVRQRRRTQ